MYIVKVDDEFCEWEFKLSGDDKYSISDLIQAITDSTDLVVIEEKFNKSYNRLTE